MKVLFYGWYYNHNAGDESYRISLPKLLAPHHATFTNELNDFLVNNNDIIVLGGGNILGGKFVESLQKYRGKAIYALSVGVSDWNLTADKLSVFKYIYVRDQNSHEFLSSIGVKSDLYPDAAFLLEPNPVIGKEMIEKHFKYEGCKLLKKKIAVIINAYLPKDGQRALGRDDFRFQVFSFDLANVLDRIQASFIFIPFGAKHPWDDRAANGWIATKCVYPQKNVVCYDRFQPQQCLDIISACDAVISTRLHSTIFSLLSKVPFLDIVHNDKNKFFSRNLKVGEAVDYWDFSREQTFEKINKLLTLDQLQKDLYIQESNTRIAQIRSFPIITGSTTPPTREGDCR